MAVKLFLLCSVPFSHPTKALRTLYLPGNTPSLLTLSQRAGGIEILGSILTLFSAGTTTKGMIGFFLYIITYLPIIIFIKPHKLEKFMWPAFIGIVGTVFGIMAWAVHNNGGSAGDLVHPGITLTSSARGFRFV
jgi:cytosine/uracil/thiamine/allantoin permease